MNTEDKLLSIMAVGAVVGFAVGFNKGYGKRDYRGREIEDKGERIYNGLVEGNFSMCLGAIAVFASPILVPMGIIAAPIMLYHKVKKDIEKKAKEEAVRELKNRSENQ